MEKFMPHGNIQLSRNVQLDSLLFADLVLLASSRDLQCTVYNFNEIWYDSYRKNRNTLYITKSVYGV